MNRTHLLAGCALALLPFTAALANGDGPAAPPVAKPSPMRDVDLVICLDTSGSMEGLIDAARKKLWDVCALLAQARPMPRLRVALLQYGCEAGSERGHVVIHSDLVSDLDTVYEQLVTFKPDGSDERVGRVLREALSNLRWSEQKDALKVILVAGNESADQDSEHSFKKLAQEALQKNAVVHAIYCAYTGDDPATVQTWRDLARWGGGEFAPIELGNASIVIETPFDKELIELSSAINGTYLPYGSSGEEGQRKQVAQDANAQSCGGDSGAAGRANCKSLSNAYWNPHWDLVDKAAEEGFDFSKLAPADYPAALKGQPLEAVKAKVAELAAKRKELQARIQKLSAERQKAIDAELAKRQGEAAKTLDQALLSAIKKQGAEKGMTW